MKSILKILVLGAVLILGTTAVVDQGLAADKGSQLIFQSNMAHHNFISVANTSSNAVTVLVQYYNNEMEMAVWYLRVILGSTTVLVDPFDHMIPGSETKIGDAIMASGKMGNGHFVIAVTAVGANAEGLPAGGSQSTVPDPAGTAAVNAAITVNVLFPTFLAEDLHGTDNIDNGGVLTSGGVPATAPAEGATLVNNNLMYTKFTATDTVTEDNTSKNVGALNVGNAVPVAFNHLTGHFTEALVGTDAGGSDQTASWGGTPVVRPAVRNRINTAWGDRPDYASLNGMDVTDATTVGGQLAEKDAGGMEGDVHADDFVVSGYLNAGGNKGNTDQADPPVPTADQKIPNTRRDIRGLTGGALVLPALHGGGAETKQIMLLLSVADSFGDPGAYKLMPAMTGYMVTPMDQMGNPLDMEDGAEDPVFGSGAEDEETATASAAIIVNGISVMTNADLGKCTGTAIDGPWTLSHLTDIYPEASDGGKDFAGLDAMIDPMMNASPGWVKFGRMPLTCEKDYGDGDGPALAGVEDADGVPVSDKRTYTAGTLIVQEKSNDDLAYVTTGRALLKFITSDSTFAASWTLKSPASGMDATAEDGDLTN